MKKRAYAPKTVIRNLDGKTEKDYELEADINVKFWKSPSQDVVLDLMGFLGDARSGNIEDFEPEELKQMNERYFECVSLMIVDTDIEGLDFSTPKKAEESFNADFLPWGILHLAILMYIAELSENYGQLKNLLRRAETLSDSGTNGSQPDSELATISSTKLTEKSPAT